MTRFSRLGNFHLFSPVLCCAELSSAILGNNNVSLQQIIWSLMLVKIIESFILGFLLISKVNFEDQEEEKTR